MSSNFEFQVEKILRLAGYKDFLSSISYLARNVLIIGLVEEEHDGYNPESGKANTNAGAALRRCQGNYRFSRPRFHKKQRGSASSMGTLGSGFFCTVRTRLLGAAWAALSKVTNAQRNRELATPLWAAVGLIERKEA